MIDHEPFQEYFRDKLQRFGVSPRGVDWNSEEAQRIRFDQLTKVIDADRPEPFTLLDYGSGFGSYFDYLKELDQPVRYIGYDFLPESVEKGRVLHSDDPGCSFTTRLEDVDVCDYAVASGVFNIRIDADQDDWRGHTIEVLESMNRLARRGVAFNMLTKYSDPERMQPHLYYADPCFYFDYCKRNFAKDVALLHDYGLYDFTIIVRKG